MADQGAIAQDKQQAGRADAAGYYFEPLIWAVEAPPELVVGSTASAPEQLVALNKLSEIPLQIDLPHGLRAKVARDGFVTFLFSSWAPYREGMEFDDLASLLLRRLSVINTHIACLQTAIVQIQRSTSPQRQ